MPYKIEWQTPTVVISLKLEGVVTLTELRAFNAEIINMIDSVDRTLTHLIADFSDATLLPTKVADLRNTLTYLQHENIGWTALITNDQLMRFVTSIVSQMSQARFRSFESFEDALEFIDYVDAAGHVKKSGL